jgi:hypothetical protein
MINLEFDSLVFSIRPVSDEDLLAVLLVLLIELFCDCSVGLKLVALGAFLFLMFALPV